MFYGRGLSFNPRLACRKQVENGNKGRKKRESICAIGIESLKLVSHIALADTARYFLPAALPLHEGIQICWKSSIFASWNLLYHCFLHKALCPAMRRWIMCVSNSYTKASFLIHYLISLAADPRVSENVSGTCFSSTLCSSQVTNSYLLSKWIM